MPKPKPPVPKGAERGPRLNEDVCIGEEVKIGVNLALQRFRLDPAQEELVFPSSLNATERAYIHRYCQELGGLTHASRGTGNGRYITVRKKTEGNPASEGVSKSCINLAQSLAPINNILTNFPITEKEREDLTPSKDKNKNEATYIDKPKEVFGKLTSSTPQIPPKRGNSNLDQFRHTLPVYQMGETVIKEVNASNVILIAGETGSGKTTQVPQLIMDDCCEKQEPCRILCTQPRRIAAISIAERVALERGEKIGQTVGYQIRLESRISPQTVLTFCTNGVLLRTLMAGDECLKQVTHVIVDEVHERDRFSDFLLLCLKQALPRHPNLRVILMSATLNMELFSGYFDGCPVLCVPGNLHDVEEYFLEDILKWTNYRNKAMHKVLRKTPLKEQVDKLSEWCSRRMTISDQQPQADSAVGVSTEEESDVTTSDNAELGTEKDDLEPWVIEDMDQRLCDVWLTGKIENFHQILYLISSENVSVDYVHSDTGTTPLMAAAARGFTNIVEHLLNLGASINVKTANQWTALDFAKKFGHDEIVGFLDAQMKTLSSMVPEYEERDEFDLLTSEDRELLNLYQQSFDDEKVDINLVTSLIHKIHTTGIQGAILVFLPGYDDIVNLKFELDEDRRFQGAGFVVYLLHSSLQHSDQKRVFNNAPNGVRKIILSTNIAETSVTINDVVFVIDCGKVKEKTFDALSSLTMLKSNWISKASALQRKGRAGRCQAGKCYHMFSRSRYIHLQDFQTPEILRLPLQELCLHTKLLAPAGESILNFLGKCPQAPPQLVICNSVQNLRTIDALDESEELTVLGRHLADLPIEPRLGKMILYSVVLKCLDPVLTIVCTLSFKDPFVLPSLPSERRAMMNKKRSFAEETYSDHVVFLLAYQAWQKAKSEGWERSFCEKSYISSSTMEMLTGMRAQILTQLKKTGFVQPRGHHDMKDLNTNSENWALIKACLVAGTYPNIIRRDEEKGVLCTSYENCVRFHTSSGMMPITKATPARLKPAALEKKEIKSLPSDWLIYEEMSRNANVALAKTCTLVSPACIFFAAGHSKVTSDMILERTKTADEDSHYLVMLDTWLTCSFKNYQEAEMATMFRMKWHSMFLNRVKHPTQPYTMQEEAILQAMYAILTNAEQALGIGIPTGIGQRPRLPDSQTSGMYERRGGLNQRQHHHRAQQHPHHHPNQHHHQGYQHYNHQGNQHPHHQQYMSHHQQMYRNNTSHYNQQWSGNQQGHRRNKFHQHEIGNGDMGKGRGVTTSRDFTRSPNDSQTGSVVVTSRTDHDSEKGALGSEKAAKEKAMSAVEENCRYFIMSSGPKMIDFSESQNRWATAAYNEAKLNRAFQNCSTVYLIFMVPGNANFQGYAKMMSSVDKSNPFNLVGHGLPCVFEVEWVKRSTVPYSMTNHLQNPWNENKKVHNSKDGQELAPKVACDLLQLWDTVPTNFKQGRPRTGFRKINKECEQESRSHHNRRRQRKPKTPAVAGKENCTQATHSSSRSSPDPSSGSNSNHAHQ